MINHVIFPHPPRPVAVGKGNHPVTHLQDRGTVGQYFFICPEHARSQAGTLQQRRILQSDAVKGRSRLYLPEGLFRRCGTIPSSEHSEQERIISRTGAQKFRRHVGSYDDGGNGQKVGERTRHLGDEDDARYGCTNHGKRKPTMPTIRKLTTRDGSVPNSPGHALCP